MSNPDYIVTAGDIYSLSYAAGTNVVSYTIPVDSTYKIRVSNLAIIDGKGKTFLALKKEIENIVVRNYPLSGVQFVLSNPASFTVIVTGEVSSTVEKRAWSLSRVSSVLGSELTLYSSTRKITIKSADGKVKNVDLFKASREGDLSQNPYLRPGDTIIINRAGRNVTIGGAVERPGTYELLPGENLKRLVEYYGNGLALQADISRVEILRINNSEDKAGNKFYVNAETEFNAGKDIELLGYDSINIYSFSDLKPVAFFEGAVNTGADGVNLDSGNRVTVQFNAGENYAYFIRNNQDLFGSSSDLANAYIIRGDKYIPMDLTTALYDASYYSDETVQANDVVMIPFRQFFVTVAGAVKNPGRFPYIPDRKYDYYIGLAGGFDITKNKFKSVDIDDVNGNGHKKSEMIMPEYTITANTNSGIYYFNQYAPVITTILSLAATTLSILAVTGVLK